MANKLEKELLESLNKHEVISEGLALGILKWLMKGKVKRALGKLAKDPDIQIVIVGCDDIQYEPEELAAVIHAYNLVFVPQDIYMMCSHPYDDEEEEDIEFLDTDDWEPGNSFMMVLVQKFDELEKASDNLRKTGYYSHWPSDYYEGTVLKRQSYRRYRNGRTSR